METLKEYQISPNYLDRIKHNFICWHCKHFLYIKGTLSKSINEYSHFVKCLKHNISLRVDYFSVESLVECRQYERVDSKTILKDKTIV